MYQKYGTPHINRFAVRPGGLYDGLKWLHLLAGTYTIKFTN